MELIFRRLSQMINVIISYCYKWSIDLGFRRIHSLRKTERNPQIILSLTSYGRRKLALFIIHWFLYSIKLYNQIGLCYVLIGKNGI